MEISLLPLFHCLHCFGEILYFSLSGTVIHVMIMIGILYTFRGCASSTLIKFCFAVMQNLMVYSCEQN